MLTCQQIIELASKQLDTDILKRQYTEMTLHLWICTACRRYVKQLHVIESLAKNMDNHGTDIVLPTDVRHRIKTRLEQSKVWLINDD